MPSRDSHNRAPWRAPALGPHGFVLVIVLAGSMAAGCAGGVKSPQRLASASHHVRVLVEGLPQDPDRRKTIEELAMHPELETVAHLLAVSDEAAGALGAWTYWLVVGLLGLMLHYVIIRAALGAARRSYIEPVCKRLDRIAALLERKPGP